MIDSATAGLRVHRGFQDAYDLCENNNFSGRPAPPMTHWTGTTVDFAYSSSGAFRVLGAYVEFTPLSDHLPVIFDVAADGSRA